MNKTNKHYNNIEIINVINDIIPFEILEIK